MVTIILLAISICLFVIICVLLYWMNYYKSEFYSQQDMFLYYKNKMSMVEYQFRNYKEGKNPFTVLRSIGDIVQDYYLKLGANNKGDNEDE